MKLTSLSPPPSPVAMGDGDGAELADVFSSADIDQLRKLSSGTGPHKNLDNNRGCIEIKVSPHNWSWS